MAKKKADKSKIEKVERYQSEWGSGKKFIDSFTKDFPDLDALADGMPLNQAKGAPIIGSSTIPNAVKQIPRASIQQLPVFSVEVNGTKQSIPALVCDYIVRRAIFNPDTFGKGILSTMQIAAESALTRGFQPMMASVSNLFNDFGTVMELVHYNDIVIEPGVFDANDSSYFIVRTRVTKSRIKRLIKKAEANPDTSWNVTALKELLENGPNAESRYSELLSEARDNPEVDHMSNSFDIKTRYEVGPYGEITTYATGVETPLRVQKSKSKFGYPRVQFLVLDPAQLLPFGVSRVRLASASANYANIYLQSTAKQLLLNADPPVLQKGQFTTPIRLKRGALWHTLDPQADVTLKELSNSTMSQFERVLDFMDNQVYSIMGVTPGSVGNKSSGGAYQNTVSSNMEKNVSDLANTQITNILENTLRQYALTGLDLFVSEQVGQTPLIVDDKCKNAINRLAPGTIGDDNEIIIDWAAFYEGIKTWTIEIDLSMGKHDLEDKKRQDIQDMLVTMTQNADPNDVEKQQRIRELEDTLLENTVPEAQRLGQDLPSQTPEQPVESENLTPM